MRKKKQRGDTAEELRLKAIRARAHRKVREQLSDVAEAAEKQEETEYDRIANRVIAATEELNAAIAEAYELSEMRVEFWRAPKSFPARYLYRIYRLTNAVMEWTVDGAEEEGWSNDWRKALIAGYRPVPKPDVDLK